MLRHEYFDDGADHEHELTLLFQLVNFYLALVLLEHNASHLHLLSLLVLFLLACSPYV